MTHDKLFSFGELRQTAQLRDTLIQLLSLDAADVAAVTGIVARQAASGGWERDVFGFNPVHTACQTALLAAQETGMKRDGVLAIVLGACPILAAAEATAQFGPAVARILHGMARIREVYRKAPAAGGENFRKLLVSFAEDMRVILYMIADRVCLMRLVRDTPALDARRALAQEAASLWAPLAHKLGLYKLKSELEDLSLKYLETDAYYMIREKLNATKRARDAYIEQFIGPIADKLTAAGLHFHMKGRTKSIHSIWQKMKKQQCGFEGIYDLFAIRIILDAPPEREKMACWQAYSIVTDMYQPNPKRLRDWLSVPKSNGYESLHITVLGPGQKWVEVQIRTERMDAVAERGLAAHWRYKGIKGESGIDEWLAGIRQALEAGDDAQLMDQFRADMAGDEVYVFTPKGDLLKFPKGATILDFAYHIHTSVGNHCTGGRVNGRAVPIREPLCSGDEVEIITQSGQTPKQDWLSIVVTARAKAKLRLALKETQAASQKMAREDLERKFKNRKQELDDSHLMRLIKKLGYKEATAFYKDIADGRLDTSRVLEHYQALLRHEQAATAPAAGADDYKYDAPAADTAQRGADDVLVIERGMKGIDYTLATCCHPIFGDPVFGFVTVSGGIKIHTETCPNAPELRRRFGYRIVRAKWSGKGASQYNITLRILGEDRIGVVNNITGIISKEDRIALRSINVDSADGLFRGALQITIDDTAHLEALLRKLRQVNGVKQITRL